MKKLADALLKVTEEVSHAMTADVRVSALNHGWDAHSVFGTSVTNNEGQFNLEIDPAVKNRVMDWEYGTQTSRPTAVFRKYGNNTAKIEAAIVSKLEKEIGFTL